MSTKVGAKTKGWIKDNVTGETKSFMFNPTTLEYSRGVTYADVDSPGIHYPGTQFVKGNARSFSVELYLYDRPYTGVMRDWSIFLGRMLTSETNVSWGDKIPHDLTFCYGRFVRRCVLEDLTIKNTLLDDKLNPIEATYTLQLRQVSP